MEASSSDQRLADLDRRFAELERSFLVDDAMATDDNDDLILAQQQQEQDHQTHDEHRQQQQQLQQHRSLSSSGSAPVSSSAASMLDDDEDLADENAARAMIEQLVQARRDRAAAATLESEPLQQIRAADGAAGSVVRPDGRAHVTATTASASTTPHTATPTTLTPKPATRTPLMDAARAAAGAGNAGGRLEDDRAQIHAPAPAPASAGATGMTINTPAVVAPNAPQQARIIDQVAGTPPGLTPPGEVSSQSKTSPAAPAHAASAVAGTAAAQYAESASAEVNKIWHAHRQQVDARLANLLLKFGPNPAAPNGGAPAPDHPLGAVLCKSISRWTATQLESRVAVECLLVAAQRNESRADAIKPIFLDLLAKARSNPRVSLAPTTPSDTLSQLVNSGWPGQTPLGMAVRRPDSLPLVRTLLALGANPSLQEPDAAPPLLYAVQTNNMPLLQTLLEAPKPAYPNLPAINGTFIGWTPLIAAARLGNANAVAAMLLHIDSIAFAQLRQQPLPSYQASKRRLGVDETDELLSRRQRLLHHRDLFGRSLMHAAVSPVDPQSSTGVLSMLLALGGDVNARDEQQRTPLMDAVMRGLVPCVKLLLAAGADVHATNIVGRTAVHVCASWQDTKVGEIMALLLQAGANPDAQDRSLSTPLHVAASLGFAGHVTSLIRAGANLHVQNSSGTTPLHYGARQLGPRFFETTKALLSAGAPVNLANKRGFTPLHDAVANAIPSAVAQLIAHGADPNMRIHATGMTALHLAAFTMVSVNVRHLLSAGALVNAVDGIGKTPLSLALGSKQITQMLLDESADVQHASAVGNTPLHFASLFAERAATIPLLVKYGANVNGVNARQRTPLHLAALKNLVPTADALIRAGADLTMVDDRGNTPALLAMKFGHGHMARALLRYEYNFDASNHMGETMVHLAARHGALEIMELLGPDLSSLVNHATASQFTALHFAATAHPLAITMSDVLLNAGADVNACTARLQTPLMMATFHDNVELVSLLLERGADARLQDRNGHTALGLAIRARRPSVAARLLELPVSLEELAGGEEMLSNLLLSAVRHAQIPALTRMLELGANPNSGTKENYTLLLCAVRNCVMPAILTLLEHGGDPSAKTHNGVDLFLVFCRAALGSDSAEYEKVIRALGAARLLKLGELHPTEMQLMPRRALVLLHKIAAEEGLTTLSQSPPTAAPASVPVAVSAAAQPRKLHRRDASPHLQPTAPATQPPKRSEQFKAPNRTAPALRSYSTLQAGAPSAVATASSLPLIRNPLLHQHQRKHIHTAIHRSPSLQLASAVARNALLLLGRRL